jgi:hypothetical protein
MLVKPERRLPCAPEFLDLVEDQPDSLLDAAIWILLITIARLDEPDRRNDDEFAATGLLVARGERAWRSRSSSYSLRLPFNPSRSRSLPWRGA